MQKTGLLLGEFCTEVILGLHSRFPHLHFDILPLAGTLNINGQAFYNLRSFALYDDVVGKLSTAIQGIIDKNTPRKRKRRRN